MPCYRIFDGVVCKVQSSTDNFEFTKSASGFPDAGDESSNFDGNMLTAKEMAPEDASSVMLEAHINATWTQNEAVDGSRYDEFATYSNSTFDTAQTEWLDFG